MPKPRRRIIVPHERTLVSSLYPGSSLATSIGSTVVASLAPLILDNPGANRELWTFVSSLPAGALTRAGVRLVTHADRFDQVMSDIEYVVDRTQWKAWAIGVYIERAWDKHGNLQDKPLWQQAALQLMTHVGSLSGTMPFGELGEKARGGWFEAIVRYTYCGVLDYLRADLHWRQRDRPLEEGAPWTCLECGHETPEPPETGICPCGAPVLARYMRELSGGSRKPDPRGVDPRLIELRYLKARVAQDDLKLAWFIDCLLRALTEPEPGETPLQGLARLTGWNHETIQAWIAKLAGLCVKMAS